MNKYRLDELGWFQFEEVIQSLLKVELGLGVQAWGGGHDFGRDAYIDGEVRFPGKKLNTGKFIFQCKFFENANAAGAKSDHLVLGAVRREIEQIVKRISEGHWTQPDHYIFITNAPLGSTLRDEIELEFKKVLPSTSIHSLSGDDVSRMLDIHPKLRATYPQLLGIQDLAALLAGVTDKPIQERSSELLRSAQDLADVFVPTKTYVNARRVLERYNFVVLEGPPEMGKTAIAEMIALVKATQGWEAVVCRQPEDFLRRISADNKQIFIADDAFGRTEYNSARGKEWEADLESILRKLNRRHQLIWTSRRHILERAMRQLDLQGTAREFPRPANILVDASKLRSHEKALMLYRHAKAAGLDPRSKSIIRDFARMIIDDPAFTPERIRRLVQDRLVEIVKTRQATYSEEIISEVIEALRNPTDRMRKSYNALPKAQKWLLVSLLESENNRFTESVKAKYEAHCPPEDHKPFDEIVDELREAFIRVE